jgi:Secretion system C-terminal sorting domain/Calx-beta domain
MLRGPFIIFLLFLSALIAQAQNPVVQFVLTSWSISEGIGTYGVAIDIINPNANPTSVDINVLPGGTAAHGVNFTYSPVTVTFQANSQTDQIVTITIIDDSIQDADKYFTFKLANATNNATIGPDSELVFTMINDDTVKFNLPSPLTVPKTAGAITFPVDLDPIKSDSAVHARVRVGAGTTAVQGVDYQFNDTIISWPAFTRGTIQVPVTILNDTLIEPNKKVVFTLTDSATGIPLTDSVFTLTILEDDSGPPVILQFNTVSDTISNPDSTITVYPVSVQFYDSSSDTISFVIITDLANSTAIDGNIPPADYNYGNQPFTFYGPGQFTYNMSFNVFNNTQISPTKKAIFRFVSIYGNAKLGADSVFTLYITNQNKLIASFMGAGYSYPKDTSWVMVPVIMSTFPNFPVSVDVSLAPGNAVLGKDFTFTDTTVIFPPFSSDTQGVWVHILNNSIDQSNKQVNLNLSNPTNGVLLGITGYTLTIIDDDSLLSIPPLENEESDIFPNPATNLLFLPHNTPITSVKIIDIMGRTVLEYVKSQGDLRKIDISSLITGIYLVNIETEKGNSSYRFLKD